MTRLQRGAALLLVMWLILLLSGMVAGFAMAARIESMQGNGLARGSNDVTTQMNVDIGSWVTDNNTNYSSAESTTFASTLAAGATSVWRFAGADVDTLFTAVTNRITVTIRDADNDRTLIRRFADGVNPQSSHWNP